MTTRRRRRRQTKQTRRRGTRIKPVISRRATASAAVTAAASLVVLLAARPSFQTRSPCRDGGRAVDAARHTDVTRAIAPLQLHGLSWFVTPAPPCRRCRRRCCCFCCRCTMYAVIHHLSGFIFGLAAAEAAQRQPVIFRQTGTQTRTIKLPFL